MSLHYLLDGYNILHQMPRADESAFEQQRERLIGLFQQSRPHGSLKNQMTIVFDGYGKVDSSTIKVIFSGDESADSRIRKMVEQSQNAKNIIVVTDDRDIQYAVRASGAKVCAVKDFLQKSDSKFQKKPNAPSGNSSKKISKAVEFKINSELENIWLKKDKS